MITSEIELTVFFLYNKMIYLNFKISFLSVVLYLQFYQSTVRVRAPTTISDYRVFPQLIDEELLLTLHHGGGYLPTFSQ